MNENSRLIPRDIIVQSHEALRYLIRTNEHLERSKMPMNNFIEDNTLHTASFNNLKQKMSDTRRLTDVFILANERDIEDYQKLLSLLDSVPILEGRLILDNIRITEENIIEIEGRIESMFKSLDDYDFVCHVRFREVVNNLRERLEKLEHLLYELKKKVQLYIDIEEQTRKLFVEGVNFVKRQ